MEHVKLFFFIFTNFVCAIKATFKHKKRKKFCQPANHWLLYHTNTHNTQKNQSKQQNKKLMLMLLSESIEKPTKKTYNYNTYQKHDMLLVVLVIMFFFVGFSMDSFNNISINFLFCCLL